MVNSQVLFVIDVDEQIEIEKVFELMPSSNRRKEHYWSKENCPRIDRSKSIDWNSVSIASEAACQKVIDEVRQLKEYGPVDLYVAGRAPLEVFIHIGYRLTPWLGDRQFFLNKRKDGSWDQLELNATAEEQSSDYFSQPTVFPESLESESGPLGLFVSSSFALNRDLAEAFIRGDDESRSSIAIAEMKGEFDKALDSKNCTSAMNDLNSMVTRIAATLPKCRELTVFLAGSASLAFMLGRAINPNIFRVVNLAHYSNGHYEKAISLPFKALAHEQISDGSTANGTKVSSVLKLAEPKKTVTISWLHLTDLHWGNDDQKDSWPAIRYEFHKDVARLSTHFGTKPYDFVVFTGDLVNRGEKDEFNDFESKFLAPLWNRFEQLGCNPKLFAVPGNHDLTRPKKNAVVNTLINICEALNSTERKKLWGDSEENEYRPVLERCFENYANWQKNSDYCDIGAANLGFMPGDASWVFEKEGIKLGLVGLNSALAHLADCKEGQLEMGPKQFHVACQPDGPSWIEKQHLNFLLTHHPADWLHPSSLDSFRSDIFNPDWFGAHFYGHCHVPLGESLSQGGSLPRQSQQGPSLFGLSQFEGPNGVLVDRIHGYTAYKLEIHDEKATLRCYPRIANKIQSGKWNVARDTSYELANDGSYVVFSDLPLQTTN